MIDGAHSIEERYLEKVIMSKTPEAIKREMPSVCKPGSAIQARPIHHFLTKC